MSMDRNDKQFRPLTFACMAWEGITSKNPFYMLPLIYLTAQLFFGVGDFWDGLQGRYCGRPVKLNSPNSWVFAVSCFGRGVLEEMPRRDETPIKRNVIN